MDSTSQCLKAKKALSGSQALQHWHFTNRPREITTATLIARLGLLSKKESHSDSCRDFVNPLPVGLHWSVLTSLAELLSVQSWSCRRQSTQITQAVLEPGNRVKAGCTICWTSLHSEQRGHQLDSQTAPSQVS